MRPGVLAVGGCCSYCQVKLGSEESAYLKQSLCLSLLRRLGAPVRVDPACRWHCWLKVAESEVETEEFVYSGNVQMRQSSGGYTGLRYVQVATTYATRNFATLGQLEFHQGFHIKLTTFLPSCLMGLPFETCYFSSCLSTCMALV